MNWLSYKVGIRASQNNNNNRQQHLFLNKKNVIGNTVLVNRYRHMINNNHHHNKTRRNTITNIINMRGSKGKEQFTAERFNRRINWESGTKYLGLGLGTRDPKSKILEELCFFLHS